MNKAAYDARYGAYLEQIEAQLRAFFTGSPAWGDLYEAMRYSLLAGGKRIRPVLALEFARLSGLGDGWAGALLPACAVELVHTYSLIHDDLPCMDDDDLRRGKPTSHKVFGETMAVLAGDALQPAAYEAILSSGLSPAQRAECALILAKASGPGGMVAGQVLDTLHAPMTEAELRQVHALKTGAMIRAACAIGCVCGNGDGAMRAAADGYAANLGLAFQIRDDMLDVIGDVSQFGKPIGSDREEGKVTFVDLFGLEGCEALVREHTDRAKDALAAVPWREAPDFLLALADTLADRRA